jgi:hypothetical protein
MKGIIFTVFNDMIEEKYGLAMLDELIIQLNPPNQGSYAAGGTYQDSELMSLVTLTAKRLNVAPYQLLTDFGKYMFPVLAKKHPLFVSSTMTLKEFLKTVDGIIHVEVKKIDQDANLPTISYLEPSPNQLIMIYQSPRQLCALATGLIQGAAAYFKQTVNINHPICMHQHADHCRLEIIIH